MTATESATRVQAALGRPVWNIPIQEPLDALAGLKTLVTGASGSVGTELGRLIGDVLLDVDGMDVRNHDRVRDVVYSCQPDVIFHLAGAKHAPHGEIDPWAVVETNTVGTKNVLDAAATSGARVILASTCKACDPETAYGASKLLAERMVLNAGGTIARFYNVVESCGNVFALWDALAEDAALPVTDCSRYFIALDEAVALLLWCAVLPPGRYTVDPGFCQWVGTVAERLYPNREREYVPARRGDRRREPLRGSSEKWERMEQPWLRRITSPHEAVL